MVQRFGGFTFSLYLCTKKEQTISLINKINSIMKKYRFYLSAFVDIMAENEEEAQDKFFEAHGNKTLDIKQTECYDYIEEDPDNEDED